MMVPKRRYYGQELDGWEGMAFWDSMLGGPKALPWNIESSHQKPFWRIQWIHRARSRSKILVVFPACSLFRSKGLLRTQMQDTAENLRLSLPQEPELCFYIFPWEEVQSKVCQWDLNVR